MNILDFVYPKKCLGCGRAGEYICSKCLLDTRYSAKVCPICFRLSLNGFSHKKCKKEHDLDGLFTIWNYERVLRKAILALKYKFASDIADEIASKLSKELYKKPFLKKDYLLIPIPLDRKRGNWRGFNQAETIGKILCSKMGWKYQNDLLVRTKFTRPQTELKGEERRKNISGAFRFLSDKNLSDQNILLFDDVWTTGSTVKEAAKVLKKAGVKKVFGLTVAKRA